MFTELFPIVTTTDMARALRFYRDALGGSVTHEFPGADGTPAYVGIDIGSSHMGIAFDPRIEGLGPRATSLWIYADDCVAAVERLREKDVPILEGPRDQPRGERVARVRDPDGNEVMIGQRAGGSRESQDSLGATLISPEPARYTRPEFERRFLVAPDYPWRDLVEPYAKVFDDLYLRHTHLRLRTLSDLSTGREFLKLTKKLQSDSPYVQMTGSIPLSPMEYEFISGLEGERIRKVRHYHFYGANVFSIDVFKDDLLGLVLCEIETESLEELMRVDLPAYAILDVTEDPFFAGGNLCRTSRTDLKRKLEALDISLTGQSADS